MSKNRDENLPVLPTLFGDVSLATPESVGGEAPVFTVPEGESCGTRHVSAGVVAGERVCVLRGLEPSFRGPVKRLGAMEPDARLVAAHAEERRAWLGTLYATAEGNGLSDLREIAERHAVAAREERLRERTDEEAVAEAMANAAPAGAVPTLDGPTERDVIAFRTGVYYMLHMIRDMEWNERVAARHLMGKEARALELGMQRWDELFTDNEES